MINLEFIVNTLSLGSLYAMLALGLVIVYGILRLVNFAYGELIMVGGYTMYLLAGFSPLPWLVIAVLAVLAGLLTSLFTELVAFRPVREKSLTAMLVTSFAVSTLLQNAALLIISPRARAVTLPQIFQTSVMIAGTSVPWRNILTIITSVVTLALLTLLLRRTVLGIALRAAADKVDDYRSRWGNIQAGFVDGNAAFFQDADLVRVHVQAQHIVAHFPVLV